MRAHACPKCPQTLILRVWSKILVFKRVENENTGIGHESDPQSSVDIVEDDATDLTLQVPGGEN